MLPCLNCKKPVEPADAKTFAGVFVCADCYKLAARFEQRGEQELRHLLVLQREAIRIALVEGRLVLGPHEQHREPTKREVLEQVLKLAETADAHKARTVTRPGHPGQQSPPTQAPGDDVRDA